MTNSEYLISIVLFIVLAVLMISIDAVELFYNFTRTHEDWELDELIVAALALIISVLVALLLALRRNTRQLRLVNEQLKNASEAKSQMIVTVSHELRTPLTSIRGAIGLLLVDAKKKFGERPSELLKLAERNVLRLGKLIDETVNIERISNNLDAFSYSIVTPSQLLEHAYEDNVLSNHKDGVSLVIKDDSLEIGLRVDENRIMQVFGNLIANACKYSNVGESVTIGCFEKDDMAVFFVKDTGTGIPLEFHNHAFERFSRADASESFHNGGAGLGLAISKAIIDNHGGKIWFESDVGVGSTFYFQLKKYNSGIFNSER